MKFNLSNNIKLSCKNNIIPSRTKSQTLTDIVPQSEAILYNIADYIQSNFSKIDILITGFIITARYNYKDIHHSQSTIARKVGCSREHVNRILRKLKKLGLVNYIYRHMTSCLYRLSSFFDQRETRQQLRKYFPILWYLPVIWLMPNETVIDKNITQLKNLYEDKIENFENRHEIFDFNNFHKLNFDKKEKDLDMKAFSEALDSTDNTSHNLNTTFPDYIETSAPILKLTGYGKAYLSCFSIEAVSFAFGKILAKDQLTGNPWSYFNKLLTGYYQDRNIEPNWHNLPDVPSPITRDLQFIDKQAVRKWIAGSSSIFRKEKEKQADRQSQAYCCPSCHLNKTQGLLKVTGNLRMCDKQRTKQGPEYTDRSGELRNEAKEKLFKSWSTLDGIMDFAKMVKLIGWTQVRFNVNGFLLPDDWLPVEEPTDIVRFIVDKVNMPF